MELSQRGAAFVQHHEGFVPRYYLDPVKIGTIGIGFTWASAAFRDWWTRNRPGQKFGPGATMTREEAQDALVLLMREEYGKAVNDFFGATLTQNQFDGVSSVVFNAGQGTLKDRWAQAAKAGDWRSAADLLKTTRITAKGKRLAGLVSRRLDEAELIELGDYTIGRPAADAMSDGMLVKGERGDAVEDLQRDLKTAGFYGDGKADGVFGVGTEAAVMEFQRAAGLSDDGFAGPQTLRAIRDAVMKPLVPLVAPEPPVATVEPIPVLSTVASSVMADPAVSNPDPIAAISKAVGAAKGGAIGAVLSTGGMTSVSGLLSAANWLPSLSTTQLLVIFGGLTAVVAMILCAGFAFWRAYKAPANAA